MRVLVPACPPGAQASATNVLRPSEPPYTAAARPAGPPPRTTRSKRVPSTSARRPSDRATCAADGLRMTCVAWTRTGVSSTGMSSHRSISALSSSVSTSYQWTGSRLRSRRSRTSNARREPRAAMRRMTPWPPSSCQRRRASIVAKRCSPSSGHRAIIERRPARSKAMTSVGSTAMAALSVGSPVNAAMSPSSVRASTCATWTFLPGLRSTSSTQAAIDDVERRIALRVLVEDLAGGEAAALALLGEPARSSRRTAAGT